MTMWIRSQDKKCLVEAKDIIEIIDQSHVLSTDFSFKWRIYVGQSKVGEYSSEKKALKVLEDMQDLLLSYISNSEYGFDGPKLFVMPQDDEVEVEKDD